MNLNWSNKQIIEFLDEVRLHPELWNVKSDVYKDRDAKKDGWASIAEKFGISSDEAYKKFKSLRTYAKNEEKRNKRGNRPVKWFAYDAISFILTEDSDTGLDGVNNIEVKELKNTAIRRNIEHIDVMEPEATESSFFLLDSKKPRISKKSISHTINPRSTLDESVEQSEYAPFGEHIAYKLSRYDGYTRAQAEMKIMQILYDCDMQMLRNQNEELVPVTVLSDSPSD